MENILVVLVPSLIAGFVGWIIGEQRGFMNAVAHVENMPLDGK